MRDTPDARLAIVGSENRAEVLVAECVAAKVPSARRLLRDWFPSSEALWPWRFELREQFERVGYVTDTKEELEFPLTIWRAAYADDDIDNALSWTTSRETADFFARHHTSIRAQFLGLYRDDMPMLIWRATCDEALAYFTNRGESEVVPVEVYDVEAVAELVTASAD